MLARKEVGSCPDYGYIFGAFDKECLRYKRTVASVTNVIASEQASVSTAPEPV